MKKKTFCRAERMGIMYQYAMATILLRCEQDHTRCKPTLLHASDGVPSENTRAVIFFYSTR